MTNVDELMSRISRLESAAEEHAHLMGEVLFRCEAALELPLHAAILADAVLSIRDLVAQ